MVFKAILTKSDVKKIAAEFKKALSGAGIRINQLILFGSYALGKPHPWSDVDFCVVSSQFGKRVYDDLVKVSKIGKRVNYLIEAHPMNPKDLKQDAHPLAGEVRRTGTKM
jgi:predicted nucleotidyltransferase